MNAELEQKQEELKTLCRRYGVRRLEVFGSVAIGQDRAEESDLDLLVEFNPNSPTAFADAYFGLLESLEELFGVTVDLVIPSAIRNPYFLKSIERTRTLLYAA